MNHAPPASSAEAETAPPDDKVLWIHPVFCELGLPIRASRGQWARESAGSAIRMEAASPEHSLPSGRMLRLALLHICDAARRTNSVSLDLGTDASVAAERMGASGKAADLVDQMHRMLAAKISVSWGGGAEFTVFDARTRPRGDLPEWRPKIRLGAKFLAGLVSHGVALDRRIVGELSESPLALDAYAWITHSLSGEAADSTRSASWNDLLGRFGTASQTATAFRTLFEPALRMVFDADPSIEIAVDEEGIAIRRAPAAVAEPAPPAAAPTPAPAVAAPKPTPAPVPGPVPAPVAAPAPVAKAPEPKASPAPAMPAPRPAEASRPVEIGRPAEPVAAPPADKITDDRICLSRDATGLPQCMWLRRGHGAEQVLVGVTPGMRFDPDKLTILAVEPMILQVSGGLHQGDFDRVSAWIMANRDLIDDFWDDRISTFQEINRRLRKVPAPGWR